MKRTSFTSYWKTVSDFVKKILHKDDDYALCPIYNRDCQTCPKAKTCKKASLPSAGTFNENVLNLINEIKSGSGIRAKCII